MGVHTWPLTSIALFDFGNRISAMSSFLKFTFMSEFCAVRRKTLFNFKVQIQIATRFKRCICNFIGNYDNYFINTFDILSSSEVLLWNFLAHLVSAFFVRTIMALGCIVRHSLLFANKRAGGQVFSFVWNRCLSDGDNFRKHYESLFGNREQVGFGWNGQPGYRDCEAFPFPSLRYKEDTAEIRVSNCKNINLMT